MIHVFHGFLGSPKDFAFLNGSEVILHDLTKKLQLQISAEDVFIGYSMGGRIALELAAKLNFNLRKLVLLATHPGLSESEKAARLEFENHVIEKLGNSDVKSFLNWWNALSIFSGDAPITVSHERFDQSKSMFEKHRLSNQENFLPKIKSHAGQILYIVGSQDTKYVTMAKTELAPIGVTVRTIDAGHRLFQRPQELKQILIEEKVL